MADAAGASRSPRHEFVYLILSHGRTQQLFRLLRTLRAASPSAAIVLHHDAKSLPLEPAALVQIGGVYLAEPRVAVYWGDESQMRALLAALTYLQQRIDFSWVSVISGQDYPLRSIEAIEDDLRRSPHDAYVKAAPVADGPYRARYFMRYRRLPRLPHYYRLPRRLRKWLRSAREHLNRGQSLVRFEGGVRGTPLQMGFRARKHPFTGDFVCYKGSDWFTLSRHAVAYLLSFNRDRPDVTEHYLATYMASESYFQTVLLNSGTLRVCDDNRRYIRWDATKLAHPRTLTMADLGEMIDSGKDFGRKFDADVDTAVLDALDRIILRQQPQDQS